MADFLGSVKKGVSAAVGRTSWEAQKQMRVRSKQTEVDKLLEQREKLLNDLAQSAIELYQKGLLTDGHLSRVCASIQELDHDVQNRETQLTELKKESYPVQQFAPAQTSDYTPPAYTPPTPSHLSQRPHPRLVLPGHQWRPLQPASRSRSSQLSAPPVATRFDQTLYIVEIAARNFVDSTKLCYNKKRFTRESNVFSLVLRILHRPSLMIQFMERERYAVDQDSSGRKWLHS